MSNIPKLKKRAAELEQRRQFEKALELYVQILDESGRELADDDVPLYNRVGDLLTRQGNVSEALAYYERAVDVYAERGYLNNAIALCSKILRQSPGRTAVYYKLGKISARKGFKSDARKNFLEYADRMQKGGHRDEAFRALKEFASIYPDQDDVRLILAEQLSKENRKGEALEQLQSLYEKLESEGRRVEARATVDRMKAIDPSVAPRSTGPVLVQGANDLVFLDLTDDVARRKPTPMSAGPVTSHGPAPSTLDPALDGLAVTFVPDEPDEPRGDDVPQPVGFEPTAIVMSPPTPSREPRIEPERTGDFDVLADVSVAPTPAPVLEESLALTDEAEAALASAPLDVLHPELEALPLEDIVPAPLTDQPPLSISEFATLELLDVARPVEATKHDLSLPSVLPLLDDDTLAAAEEAAAPDSTPFESPRVVSAPPAGEQRTVDEAVPAEAAPLATGSSGSEDALAARDEAEASFASYEAIGEQHAAMQVHLPEPKEPPATRAPSPGSEDIDELLSSPASFGEAELSDEVPPVLPPLPGLSDEDGAAGAESPRKSGRGKQKRGKRRSQGAPKPNGSERHEGKPAKRDAEAEARQRREPDKPLVEVPTSRGFVPLGAQVPRSDSNVTRTGEAAAPPRRADPTPRATLSLGGAEAHLRRRLELDPENWTLRRQLGEALLDTGDRDQGLYELELALAGFELTGALDRAHEIAGEIIRVLPTSVRHHQKRVEYAVRSRDRGRLIDAYLELADALFRTGEGDKSVVVYSRVAELDSRNERAMFALATLAPDLLARLTGVPANQGRFTDELETIPETGNLTVPEPAEDLPLVPAAEESLPPPIDATPAAEESPPPPIHATPAAEVSAIAAADTAPDVATHMPDEARRDAESPPEPGLERTAVGADAAPVGEPAAPVADSLPDESHIASFRDEEVLRAQAESDPATNVAPLNESPHAEEPRSTVVGRHGDAGPAADDGPPVAAAHAAPVTDDGRAPTESGLPSAPTPDLSTLVTPVAPFAAFSEPEESSAESVPEPVENPAASALPPVPDAPAPEPAPRREPRATPRQTAPVLERAKAMTPSVALDHEFVDLGEWLRLTEPARSTRMVVDDARPTGDEQADFDELLRRFKRGVAENMDAEDFDAHYDLGVAYKEMGLTDEAIAEFQKALRGSDHKVRSYEALGQCFVEKGQHSIAAALLQRVAEAPGTDDQQLVGVLYLLGFACERLGREADALRYYQRVFAVDIEFRDIAQRVSSMEHLTK